jgi:hypothetical protein
MIESPEFGLVRDATMKVAGVYFQCREYADKVCIEHENILKILGTKLSLDDTIGVKNADLDVILYTNPISKADIDEARKLNGIIKSHLTLKLPEKLFGEVLHISNITKNATNADISCLIYAAFIMMYRYDSSNFISIVEYYMKLVDNVINLMVACRVAHCRIAANGISQGIDDSKIKEDLNRAITKYNVEYMNDTTCIINYALAANTFSEEPFLYGYTYCPNVLNTIKSDIATHYKIWEQV